MKKLHTFSLWERAQAGMLKEILQREGIACILKNEQLIAAMGEIPFTECYPELWLVDDEVYPRARLFLDNWLKNDSASRSAWVCPECGEELEAQFGACWSCGQERDSDRG
jgi:hypothetical protein